MRDKHADYERNRRRRAKLYGDPLGLRKTRRRKKKGCFIATAVYGSYDCPEVWILRRFRDGFLEKKWFGRIFISMYYAISPFLVDVFGNNEIVKHHWRCILNQLVKKLRKKGIKDTPYSDV